MTQQLVVKPRKPKRGVSFALQQTAYFAPPSPQFVIDNHCDDIEAQSQSSQCWYSDAELRLSRDDARTSIMALQDRINSEDDSSLLCIDSLLLPCPINPSQTLCLRGIEKYADAAAKFAGQKRHVASVLQQQALNNKEEHMALVSRTLSQPFKDVARYYALKSAEEQEALRRQEVEEERQQVAKAVLFLLHEKSAHHSPAEGDGTVTPPELVSTTKRARDAVSCCSEEESRRNVKACIRRVISE